MGVGWIIEYIFAALEMQEADFLQHHIRSYFRLNPMSVISKDFFKKIGPLPTDLGSTVQGGPSHMQNLLKGKILINFTFSTFRLLLAICPLSIVV